ncbi:MAG: hypothetical protein HYR80_03835 [Nitrospirae bacterium]|nr:hypothetical protein [Nitrospirota bacterium]
MALYHYVDPSQLAPLQPGKIVPLNRFWEEVEGPLHLLGELPVEWLESQSEHRFYYSPLFRHPTAHSVAQIGYRHFREKKEIPENDLDLVMPEFPSVRKQQGGLHF